MGPLMPGPVLSLFWRQMRQTSFQKLGPGGSGAKTTAALWTRAGIKVRLRGEEVPTLGHRTG